MLAILDGILVDVDPVPVTVSGFEIYHDNEADRCYLFADGNPIMVGPRWYSMTRDVAVNPISGEIARSDRKSATIRVVFMETHEEIDIPARIRGHSGSGQPETG